MELPNDQQLQKAANIFDLVLEVPQGLKHLEDCEDITPPKHAEILIHSLPEFESPQKMSAPTWTELADALGFVEIEIPNIGYKWGPIEEECLDDLPSEGTLRDAASVTSAEAITRLDVTASRWEAKVREREERRRLYDWSFERHIYKPCLAIIDAMAREDEVRQQMNHDSSRISVGGQVQP